MQNWSRIIEEPSASEQEPLACRPVKSHIRPFGRPRLRRFWRESGEKTRSLLAQQSRCQQTQLLRVWEEWESVDTFAGCMESPRAECSSFHARAPRMLPARARVPVSGCHDDARLLHELPRALRLARANTLVASAGMVASKPMAHGRQIFTAREPPMQI